MNETKLCRRCGIVKPRSEFGVKNRGPGRKPGLVSRCKSCINEIGRTIQHPRRKAGLQQPQQPSIENPIEKTCTKCNITKPIVEFSPYYKNPTVLWHWSSYCNTCRSVYQREQVANGYERPEPGLALRLLEGKLKGVCDGKFKHGQKLLPFELTVAIIRSIIDSQTKDGQLYCAATGVLLDVESQDKPLSPSLDRIDNRFGYIDGNVRITSLIYNVARRKWDDDIVLDAIIKMATCDSSIIYTLPEFNWVGRVMERKRSQIKADAKRNNRPPLLIELTTTDVHIMVNLQSKGDQLHCAVTNTSLNRMSKSTPFSPSLDRIDNNFGYIHGNVRIVALIYNLARRQWDDNIVLSAIVTMATGINSLSV